jgi:Arc/MetJ-type ribon-helix-helix transcriptional regulator
MVGVHVMTLTLSPATQKLIEEQMGRGGYATVDEVILAALESLKQQQALGGFEPGELERLLAEGDADIERGDVLDGELALAERRRRRAERGGARQ